MKAQERRTAIKAAPPSILPYSNNGNKTFSHKTPKAQLLGLTCTEPSKVLDRMDIQLRRIKAAAEQLEAL